MRVLLCAALLVAGNAMSAELVFKHADTTIILTEAPCKNQRIQLMAAAAKVELPYAGMAKFGNYVVSLCWGRVGEGELVVIDDDGDGAKLPIAAFKVDKGV
jgi:hypothetical protein